MARCLVLQVLVMFLCTYHHVAVSASCLLQVIPRDGALLTLPLPLTFNTITSHSVLLVDGCVSTRERVALSITSSGTIANVTILVSNCVGVVPRIVFMGEATNITAVMRNITWTAGDTATPQSNDPLVSFSAAAANVSVTLADLRFDGSGVVLSSHTMLHFAGEVRSTAITIERSVVQRRTVDVSPLMYFSGASISSVDVVVSHLDMTTDQQLDSVSGWRTAALVQWDGFASLVDVAIRVADSNIVTTVSTPRCPSDIQGFLIGYYSSGECSTSTQVWKNLSIAVVGTTLSHLQTVDLNGTLSCEGGISVVSLMVGCRSSCPFLPAVDGLSVVMGESRFRLSGTATVQLIFVQRYFSLVSKVDIQIVGVVLNASVVGVARDKTTTRHASAVDAGGNWTQVNIAVTSCSMTLSCPLGAVPVLSTSPLFPPMRESTGPHSNFTDSGVDVLSFTGIGNFTVRVVNTTVVGTLLGTMVRRIVAVESLLFASCRNALFSAGRVSGFGDVSIVSSSISVTFGTSSISPVFVPLGFVTPISDAVLASVALVSLATRLSGDDFVSIACRSSTTSISWSANEAITLPVVTLSGFFVMSGSGLLSSMMLSLVPQQWRPMFAYTLSSLSQIAEQVALALNLDITIDGCASSLSLPPEATTNGSFVFSSIVTLPNTNYGLTIAARNVTLSWMPSWQDSSSLPSIVALSSGKSTLDKCSFVFSNISFAGSNRSAVDGCMCVTAGCTDCNAQFGGGSFLGVEQSTVRGESGGNSFGVSWLRPDAAALSFVNISFVGLRAVLAPEVVGTVATNVTLLCDRWDSVREADGADVGGNMNVSTVVIKHCAAPPVGVSLPLSPALPLSTAAIEFGVAVSAAASIFSGDAGALDLQVLMLLLGSGCGGDGGRSQSMSRYSVSPFADGGSMWIAWGNVLLSAACWGLHISVVGLMTVLRQERRVRSWARGAEAARFPGMSYSVVQLLWPGAVAGGVHLVQSSAVRDVVSGAAVLVVIVVVGATAFGVLLPRAASSCVFLRHSAFQRRWRPPLLWLFPAGYWAGQEQRRMYGPLIGRVHGNAVLWAMLPALAGTLGAAMASIEVTSHGACAALCSSLCVLYAVSAAVVVVVRPARVPAGDVLVGASYVLVACVFASTAAMHATGTDSAMSAIIVFSYGVTVVSLLKVAHMIWVKYIERDIDRNKKAAALVESCWSTSAMERCGVMQPLGIAQRHKNLEVLVSMACRTKRMAQMI